MYWFLFEAGKFGVMKNLSLIVQVNEKVLSIKLGR
jgi:hypothetical protein